MGSLYAEFPFLPGAAQRLLRYLRDPAEIPNEILSSASSRLRSILARQPDYSVLDEETELVHFVLFRIFLSFLGSEYYIDLLGRYYAERTRGSKRIDELFGEIGIDPSYIPVSDYLRYRHIYPETKLYHVPLRDGFVLLLPRLFPFFAADVAYTLSTRGLPLDVSSLPKHFKEFAARSIPPARTSAKKSTSSLNHIERVLSASGIPDGRKRIIFYWLAPYLVTVKRLSKEEAFSTIKEWLSRQGGGKILDSWVRAEVENAYKKKIRPWSLSKVRSVDPGLYELLRSMGVLE